LEELKHFIVMERFDSLSRELEKVEIGEGWSSNKLCWINLVLF
jgi:hypothetical protein